MADIIIFGAGGHAQTIAEIIRDTPNLELKAFIETDEYFSQKYPALAIAGVPVIREREQAFPRGTNAAIGVGQITSALIRKTIFDKCLEAEFVLPALVAKSATLSKSATLGDGSQILHNVVVGPNASIGRASILNSNCQVEHGSTIGNFTHISTGVIVNGDVKVGDHGFIGSGSIVREGVSISAGSIVPMGSVVKGDI